MKMKYNKSEIMKLAHCYMKSYCLSRSQALKLAWLEAILRLKNILTSSLTDIINKILKSSTKNLTININLLVGNNNSNVCIGSNNIMNSGSIRGSINMSSSKNEIL